MFKSTFENSIFRNLNKTDKVPDAASIAEYNNYFYKPALRKSMVIPKRTNILSITFTSGLEGIRYQEELAFPYDKLQFEQEKYPTNKSKFLRGEKSDTIVVNLRKDGILHLFNRFGTLLKPYQLSQKPLSLEEKQEALSNKEINKNASLQVNDLASGLEDLLANKSLYKRMSLKNRVFNWRLTGTGLEDHEIKVKDVQNYLLDDEKIEINTIEKRPLPLSFEFTYEYYCWLIIHINPEKLIDQMLPAQLDDPDAVFDFKVSVSLQKGEVDFKLIYKGAELLFSGWEKEIIAHRWGDAKNKLLEKERYNQNKIILKEIYDLLEQKHYQKAQEICKKQILLQPDFAVLYFYEARLLFYIQGYAASYAQEDYFIEKTAKESYALARIYNHYGCLLDEEKRYHETLPYFEKAHAAYSNETMYIANIAEIFHKLKQPKPAIKFAKECVEKGYVSEIIHEILGDEPR